MVHSRAHPPTMAPPEPDWLTMWRAGAIGSADALLRFDSLSGGEPKAMIGWWLGTGLPTGHPLDGLLEALGWYGKSVENTDCVHPLLFCRRPGTPVPLDPVIMPVGLALR